MYTVAPIVVAGYVPKLGPPLAGKGWVALNGCCRPNGIHRGTSLPVNGQIFFAQRFAIDWLRLDADSRLVHGDSANVHSYPCYGADVLAVADGTVVATFSTYEDQVPGTLPDPTTITLKNVDGNHIVLDLGHGIYALYAHLQKNSLLVAPGDHVKRGQVMAKLGNTATPPAPICTFN